MTPKLFPDIDGNLVHFYQKDVDLLNVREIRIVRTSQHVRNINFLMVEDSVESFYLSKEHTERVVFQWSRPAYN